MDPERTGNFYSKFNQPHFPDEMEEYADDEPPPESKGRIVINALAKWLMERRYDEAIVMASARAARGFEEYGQYLHTDDGRDGLKDLIQELADGLQYAYKLKMNGRLEDEETREQIRQVLEPLAEVVGFELTPIEEGED